MSKWGVFILAVLALLMTLSYIVISGQQTAEVTKAEFETILVGNGSSPVWSPDGTKIAYIAEDGWLTVTDVEGKGEIKKVVPIKAAGFNWLNEIEFILWEKEEQRIEGILERPIIRIKRLTLDGKEELIVEDHPGKGEAPRITYPIFLPDGAIGYYKNYFEQPPGHITGERTFKVIKFGRLKSDSTQKQMRAYVVPSGST